MDYVSSNMLAIALLSKYGGLSIDIGVKLTNEDLLELARSGMFVRSKTIIGNAVFIKLSFGDLTINAELKE